MKANKTYICEFLLIHSGDPAVDISLGWTAPAGATGMLFILGPASNITDGSVANAYFTSHNAPLNIGAGFTLGCDSTGIATVTKGKLLVSTAATAGTLAFIWSQSTSSAIATTMLANSYLKITEIN
jgi:hypothetical protein